MKKLITKGDILLFIVFLMSALLIVCVPALRTAGRDTAEAGSLTVEIRISGELYEACSLSDDQTIVIETEYGTNVIVIEDGTVTMTESDCSNQICVNTGTIRSQGQMIVCLPHRLSAEITSEEETEDTLDAISR